MKKITQHILALTVFAMLFTACNSGDGQKKLGNSQDTTSVNKAGGPAIRDTSTINKDRQDSAKANKADSVSKGNADPSGHLSAKPPK
ncbi:hypothetical protein [Mucilaginibacter aquaedulcis]|uniref:hypothetical protein n=1 Tax=Mucilaginibacter aquaedulcis TaxID=1187081 RepID=UPI0025B5F545|nr:hypothetical protein [Mucilaginibacter aquaedulcis]MDN3550221.1 hypothetical protein [Mucilaginibacter aquaedulcis]